MVRAILVVVLLMEMAAAGATTTVTGNVVPTFEINVLNADIGFATFEIGDNTKTSTSFISVSTNYDTYLQAAEAGGDGRMATSDEANVLGQALKVGIGIAPVGLDDNGDAITVSGIIRAGTEEKNYDATFVQPITYTDDVATGYTITVTFTVTAS